MFVFRLLHITAVEVRHTGEYTCRADNVAGADEKIFQVEVQGERAEFLQLSLN